MKKIIVCLLLTALLMPSFTHAERVSLPPQDEQILGDNSMVQTREVTLYYFSQNESEPGSVTRRVSVKQNDNLIETVLLELSHLGTYDFISVECSCGIVTVDLSVETAANLSRAEIYRLCVSVANTLLGLEEVEAVNILIGGQSCTVYNLPQGVFTEQITNVSVAYAQIQAESELYSEQGGSISRHVMFYFPAKSGDWFLPEVKTVSFDANNVLNEVFNALMDGPQTRACCYSPIPVGVDYLPDLPTVDVSDTGERIITLNFSSALYDYLAFAGIDSEQLYGSVALTLLSFYPETAAVQIQVGGVPVVDTVDGFANGLIYRSDYTAMIGSSACLFCANAQNKLTSVEQPMSQATSVSAINLLREMISMNVSDNENLHSVFPDGIVPEDILGISLDGRVATVNLSAAFYAHCQNLSNEEEHLLIYAMVNALCELEQIGAVSFRVEGTLFESLSGEIYMKSSLLPDPGLISD